MKLRLKGRRFASIEEVQAESQQILNMLMPADFNEGFQKWQNRWDRSIQAQGDYFRRWRWKLGLKVSIHVITSKFSEILGSAVYNKVEGNTKFA